MSTKSAPTQTASRTPISWKHSLSSVPTLARWHRAGYVLPIAGLVLLLFTLIVKSAWMGDDAYIPIRSIDNLLNGYGLRWNIDERVQVFTDPFWTLLIAGFYAVTGEIFITVIVMCIVTSMMAVVVITSGSRSPASAVAGLLALISSKAFVDYTTSGLENPLSYLLVALFAVACFREHDRTTLRRLILLYALVGFNRLDLLLMLSPALLLAGWTAWRGRKVTLRALLLDGVLFSAPLWGWLLFATIYFGYALPNTYYAKLNTGIPAVDYVKQGLLYYLNSINYDAVTLLVIGLAVATGALSKNPFMKAGALGLVLYLAYVVKIGGDFMSGRFFSVPFLFAVALLLRLRIRTQTSLAAGIVFFVVGATAQHPTITYNADYTGVVRNRDAETRISDVTDLRGISDERGTYFQEAGLMTVVSRSRVTPRHSWGVSGQAARRKRVDLAKFGTPGFYGYYAGPGVHIIDTFALADPLLSQLPVYDNVHWRIGHYGRSIPVGYLESLQTGRNLIADPAIRELHRVTQILTRDRLWSAARMKEIFKANLGYYTRLKRAAPRIGVSPPLKVGEPVELPNRRFTGVYQYGSAIRFGSGGNWGFFASQGWSHGESGFAWTVGPTASLLVPVTPSSEPLTLRVTAGGHMKPPEILFQPVDLFVNGVRVASWEISDHKVYRATVPTELAAARGELLHVEFAIPKAFSPAQASVGTDTRQLGMRVVTITISPHRDL